MNIYQSNIYREDLSWLHFDDEPRVQEKQAVQDQQSFISVFVAYPIIHITTRSISPDMKILFHSWSYNRFIEIQSNLRRKKLHRMFIESFVETLWNHHRNVHRNCICSNGNPSWRSQSQCRLRLRLIVDIRIFRSKNSIIIKQNARWLSQRMPLVSAVKNYLGDVIWQLIHNARSSYDTDVVRKSNTSESRTRICSCSSYFYSKKMNLF